MEALLNKQKELAGHPVYQCFDNLESIRHFMSYHVFAVWDFMSLLKSLQRHITCVSLPWKPSPYPTEMVRLINQIVVGEESDVTGEGEAVSHFELYLRAMNEVGASTVRIETFLRNYDLNLIPEGVRDFVKFNLNLAENGHVVEVAANFFYGREKLIPEMFQKIVDTLKRESVSAPTFLYYLERHIEVDSGEHGPLALKCLEYLTADSDDLKNRALKSGLKALEMRQSLWDTVLKSDHFA